MLPTLQLTSLKRSNLRKQHRLIQSLPNFTYILWTQNSALEDIKQELNDASVNYKAALPHLKKHLMIVIADPLNILTGHLQYH